MKHKLRMDSLHIMTQLFEILADARADGARSVALTPGKTPYIRSSTAQAKQLAHLPVVTVEVFDTALQSALEVAPVLTFSRPEGDYQVEALVGEDSIVLKVIHEGEPIHDLPSVEAPASVVTLIEMVSEGPFVGKDYDSLKARFDARKAELNKKD